MKEIKAYIRPEISHRVIEQLKKNGATNISIVKAKGIGVFEDPLSEEYDLELIEKSSNIYKLELICKDEDAEKFIQIIKKEAHTGKAGDGAIFVSEIERAIKIWSQQNLPESGKANEGEELL
jgi:nitrogen regulatory protein P-II 1